MKRIIALFLVLSLCFIMCSCSNSDPEETETDKVISAVKAQINTRILLSYEINGIPTITTFVDNTGDNTYEVSGKVTVKDKYGDSYTGKYDATVEYDPDTDDCDVDLELGELYKD